MNKTIFLLASVSVLLTACSLLQSTPDPVIPEGFTACPEVRPEMCTLQYVPAEALMRDGSMKSFSNACNACLVPDVVATRKVG